MPTSSFPTDFLWGAATSAYQIEGSPLADGAGESIWHRFSHRAGKIEGGDNGDVACDHYRRMTDDVRLMRELGLQSYRFSIAWGRVLPEGTGRINQAGVDFYSRLVDTLLEYDIIPSATLYHWDLPAVLDDRGGWAYADAPQWFTEYAELMFRALGDRVPMWTTLNEPWVAMDNGYVTGGHAPGRRDWREAALVSHNLLRSHAAAVALYRSHWKHKIGLVVNLVPVEPATDSAADRAAAVRMDAYLNRHFLDPALLGTFPDEMPELFGDAWPTIDREAAAALRQPVDFIGVNYYLRIYVRDDPAAGPSRATVVSPPDRPRTALGWEIYANGLADTLQWVSDRYDNVPQYVTENGAAFDDFPAPDGTINDAARVQYLKEHLQAALQALQAGVRLRGYFVWSLLDNFEWHFGYSKRFGIVRVDYPTQRRTPKASARFYADVIRSRGTALEA
ncbi:MAG: GH1 family beta-glucosidase [Pirellulales bacterium]